MFDLVLEKKYFEVIEFGVDKSKYTNIINKSIP